MSSDSPPTPPRQRPDRKGLIPGRIESWRDVVPIELSRGAIRRARAQTLLLAALFAIVILVYDHRASLLGVRRRLVCHGPRKDPCEHAMHLATTATTATQVITVALLVLLGWAVARDFGRILLPSLLRRADPATAGTIGFLVRLVTLLAAIIVALRIGGVDTATIAIGASFTAVVFGLAAQQTLGNLIAGTVLLSARPFRVGDRVRLQGGGLAGQIEGTATSLGLLYTTFTSGEDHVLVPNSVVLAVAVTPLREPSAVSLRARLRPGTTPIELQRLLEDGLTIPLRARPSITLEELDGPHVVVKISATPISASDGAKLASELLATAASLVQDASGSST
jgi:small-conductance mechanosensitive channel